MYFIRLNHEGYKCLNLNRRVIISGNVIFDELSFPFSKKKINNDLYHLKHETFSSIDDIILFKQRFLVFILKFNQNLFQLSHYYPLIHLHKKLFLYCLISNQMRHKTVLINIHSMRTRAKSGIFKN